MTSRRTVPLVWVSTLLAVFLSSALLWLWADSDTAGDLTPLMGALQASPDPLQNECPVPSRSLALSDQGVESPSSADPIAASVRFLVRTGLSSTEEFAREPVTVLIDGAPVSGVTDAGEVLVPHNAQVAEFRAPGYQPIVRRIPRVQNGRTDFGEVVFEPDARVVVHLVGPALASGMVVVSVGKGHMVWYSATTTLVDGVAEVSLRAPSYEDLRVSAHCIPGDHASFGFGFTAVALRLECGETGVLSLHGAAGAVVNVQVLGVPQAVSSIMTVKVQQIDMPAEAKFDRQIEARLDASCSATFALERGTYQFGVDCARQWVPLRLVGSGAFTCTVTGDAVLNMEPQEALAAVFVCEGRRRVGSLVALDRIVYQTSSDESLQLGHVFPVTMLDACKTVYFWTPVSGLRGSSLSEARVVSGVYELDADCSRALAGLQVLSDVFKDFAGALGIIAEEVAAQDSVAGGAKVIRIPMRDGQISATVEEGTYTIRWEISGAPGPVIEKSLCLTRGAT